jgi:hypothetical protein
MVTFPPHGVPEKRHLLAQKNGEIAIAKMGETSDADRTGAA